MSIKGVFQARCCSQFRQWWARCPCSRRTSGGRCSCTGPGRCEPSGHWPRNQTCPGVSCCSRAAVDARSLPPAGAGSWPLWSANGRGDNKQHLQRFIFHCLGKVSGIWILTGTLWLDWSHLHNDQFALGVAQIMQLLTKTQSHCRVGSRKLPLLVQLQSWNTQSTWTAVRTIFVIIMIFIAVSIDEKCMCFELLKWLNMEAHLEETFQCQKSWRQRPSQVSKAWDCIASPPLPARSRRLGSGTTFWWRCRPGWHVPARLSPGGPGAYAWHGAGGHTLWAQQRGNEHSACCLNCIELHDQGAAVGRCGSLRDKWQTWCSSVFLRSRNWSSSGRKLEQRTFGELCRLEIIMTQKEMCGAVLLLLWMSDYGAYVIMTRSWRTSMNTWADVAWWQRVLMQRESCEIREGIMSHGAYHNSGHAQPLSCHYFAASSEKIFL